MKICHSSRAKLYDLWTSGERPHVQMLLHDLFFDMIIFSVQEAGKHSTHHLQPEVAAFGQDLHQARRR